MADYEITHLKLTALTPLHIGTGRELMHEYDYAIHDRRTWRLNEDKILDEQAIDDPKVLAQLMRTPPGRLLKKPLDFQPGREFFRYVIEGTPRSAGEGAQLREQLKDAFDRPYVPGSGVKGALRTAVAWHAWRQQGMRLKSSDLDRRKEWAAQPIERAMFGPTPNKNLWRALHVTDSTMLGADALAIFNVRVLSPGGKLASPIELEMLKPGATVELALKLDRALFSDWARRGGLNLSGREWLEGLPAILNAHAQARMRREAQWFREVPNGAAVASFYEGWVGRALTNRRMIMQLGWGTGWDGKTLGAQLGEAQADEFERIIGDYRLARGRRERGDPFPKSRRVAVGFTRRGEVMEETPALPLGWVMLEVKRA